MIIMPYDWSWSSVQLTGHADFWQPVGALEDDLIDQRRQAICWPVIASRRVRGYGEHRVCLPGPTRQRWTLLENLYLVTGKVHPFPADPQVSSIAPVPPLCAATAQR